VAGAGVSDAAGVCADAVPRLHSSATQPAKSLAITDLGMRFMTRNLAKPRRRSAARVNNSRAAVNRRDV
jgi:hypothetical protein